ncbi:uncharacterized protein LACBIDRAFT_306303 [Laccaria bicolor S238N-H82]|uniref:Predicted protein n=1 Tax=Laccaria bicolor (strain S238N-H82 / ATCC MYA-4686) TaxID=486041 RepID=B0DN28_LACBS|nr:uncharacterized protein LACBIDRAFT_306303 [Laccaria bicolor S238N-H82]EDR03980.1 predicted protein [Laccaria bicolor S238N-H82]|eukprot:XP_001885235.1 predicted protein [Laccaria bicolor S238N-H82]
MAQARAASNYKPIQTLAKVLGTTSAAMMPTMPRCDSPQPLPWTTGSFPRFYPGRPVRSPSSSPPSLDSSICSEAPSTLSDSSISLITPESSLLLDRDTAGVYNYVPTEDFKPSSPSLVCASPGRLPHLILVALKDELPVCRSHGLVSEEVALDNFFVDDSVAQPNPATGTLSSFSHTGNEKQFGMGDENTTPRSPDARCPVFDEKIGLGPPPCMTDTPRMLQRIPSDPVCDLSDEVETTEQFSVAHGGFSDIYKGVWAKPFGGEKGKTVVAIKLLRAFTRQEVDPVRARKRLNREVYVWNRLVHHNIARFYGISFRLGGRPSIVMQWYQNGTVPDYIDTQLRVNGVEVDRLSLVRDIAQGLGYLHSLVPPVVHGDLKGNNTLVNDDGHAMLTDFGLAKVIEELAGPTGNTTSSCAGSVRWQAPELIFDTGSDQDDYMGDAPKPSSPTPASDVWSFGCTAYEIMSGKIPYHTRLHDWTVIQAIVEKQCPVPHEEGVLESNGLMSILHGCWQYDAGKRPEMGEVLRRLQSI